MKIYASPNAFSFIRFPGNAISMYNKITSSFEKCGYLGDAPCGELFVILVLISRIYRISYERQVSAIAGMVPVF